MAFNKLNDLELEVEDGMNIIQVAQQVGIEVPHYCFHSGLSRPANCRMCLVEPVSNTHLTLPTSDLV